MFVSSNLMTEASVTGQIDNILTVENVSRTFVRRNSLFKKSQGTAALQNVSMELRRGEILGVVGESGSGKSTLGKVIVGLERPDSGRIVLNNRILVGDSSQQFVPASQRGIGMIFQDPYSSLNPRMKVSELVGEGLKIEGKLGRKELDERISEFLVMVGLRPEDRHRYAHQFSGGQRQRIGIARAIIMHPKVLIADEAVSSLDVSVQMQVLNLLLDIREKLGLSLVFITHNIGVVEYLCDRVIVLSRGEVMEKGDVLSVIGNPQHPYTQRLISAVPRL